MVSCISFEPGNLSLFNGVITIIAYIDIIRSLEIRKEDHQHISKNLFNIEKGLSKLFAN